MKKLIAFSIAFLLLCGSAIANEIERYQLLPSCIFSEDCSSISGMEKRGAAMTSYPTIVDSARGKAITLDGVDDLITFPESQVTSCSNITICGWIKPSDADENGYILAQTNVTDAGGWGVYWTGSSDTLRCYHNAAVYAESTAVFVDTDWTFFTVTIDSSNNVTFYRNGALVNVIINHSGFTAGEQTVTIGNRTGGGSATALAASVKDLMVFNRLLSLAEIEDIYYGTTFDYDKNLLSYWDMSDINPADKGFRALGYDGTGSGLVTSTDIVNGKVGKAIEFDGASEHLTIGEITQLNGVANFSFSFWLKQNVLDSLDYLYYYYKDSDEGMYCRTKADGDIEFMLENGADASASFDYSTVIAAKKWSLITLAYDGTGTGNAGRLKIYIDGSEPTLSYAGTVAATAPTLTGITFYIAGIGDTLDGSMDEWRIFNSTLTRLQHEDLYVQQGGR